MPNSEHPLISIRRILHVAVADQLALARESHSLGYANALTPAIARQLASNANQEAGRLTQRLLAVQERIEELDLD